MVCGDAHQTVAQPTALPKDNVMIARYLAPLLLVCLGVVLLMPSPARAQDDRHAVIEGRFVRLTEVQIGEGENLALIVRVPGRGDATIVVPRRNEELMPRARALREGDVVRIEAVREGERWWVQALRVGERVQTPREADREQPREREREVEREGAREVEQPREREREVAREGEREADREVEQPRERERETEREADRPREETDRRAEGDRVLERETDRSIERPDAERREGDARGGVLEGWHANTTLARVGDTALTGLMIRVENGDWLLVVVPRENERLQTLARRLERDDRVRISFEMRDGKRWLTGLDVSAR